MTPATEKPTNGNGNGMRAIWMSFSAVAGALIWMVVGQFVPQLQLGASHAQSIATLERRMEENFSLVRGDIHALEQRIARDIEAHRNRSGHDGAIQRLIQNGERLSDHEARIRSLERKGGG